jgi:ankyrin repeat protein
VAADPRLLHSRMSRADSHQLPLHVAARRGRPEIVALLVELGADPFGVDAAGHDVSAYATTPYADQAAMAAIHGFTQVELVSARRGKRAPLGRSIDLIAALAVDDTDSAAELGVQPHALHVMAKRGDTEAVHWLLDHGADPNALWSHWDAEVTPLHLAAAQGHTDVIRLLLDAGADATIHDSVHDGNALGWAEHFGQAEAAKLLVVPADEEPANVVLEFSESDEHMRELLEAFEDGWVVGIASRAGLVRLELETPGATWGAAVSLVERRLDRLAFDWRSHASCMRP